MSQKISRKSYGDGLKTARKEKGISQKDLAAQLGLKTSTYSNYENNYSTPTREVLDKMSELLDIDMDQYLKDFYDQRESKDAFTNNYKYEIEQLIFFEELKAFRHYIDGIEDKKLRRRIANHVSEFLDQLMEFQKLLSEGHFDALDDKKYEIKKQVDYVLDDMEDIRE